MANPEHLAWLREGAAAWNRRQSSQALEADLTGADLQAVDLAGAHLNGADLSGADLSGADLSDVRLGRATLHGADLSGAKLGRAMIMETDLSGAKLGRAFMFEADLSWSILREADLSGAILTEAILKETVLSGADLRSARLWGADLREASLPKADLTRAELNGANLRQANLTEANLTEANLAMANLTSAMLWEANLTGATLSAANLTAANLRHANLAGADLSRAILVDTFLQGATLTGCRIYGVAVWNANLEGTEQSNLIIRPPFRDLRQAPDIMVDDIEVAQFVYLILDNRKIRNVIATVGKKAVLVLGRFTDRMFVLDAIREELRRLGYLPIVFDFERVTDRDFTETIMTLAGMCRFVLVDITNPRSSPLELQATVPNYMIPFVPIIQRGEPPFAMFRDLQQKYSWVLDVRVYDSVPQLIEKLEVAIIEPALEKHAELTARKVAGLRAQDIDDWS